MKVTRGRKPIDVQTCEIIGKTAVIREKEGLTQMVYMIFANLLFLFRNTQVACKRGFDQVQPPKMAHSLLYSTIRANAPTKKVNKYLSMKPNSYSIAADNCRRSLIKKVLDNFVSLCYNGNITIEKASSTLQPYAAQPVNIAPFEPQQEKNTLKA